MKKKSLTKKEKKYVICLIAFFVFALVVSIKSVYAYYYKDSTPSGNLFANVVGNIYEYLDGNQGDISIRVYKKVSGGSIYTGIYEIPTNGTLTDSLTSCHDGSSAKNKVTCTKVSDISTASSSGCYYSYSSNSIKIKSSQKAICSFYFE